MYYLLLPCSLGSQARHVDRRDNFRELHSSPSWRRISTAPTILPTRAIAREVRGLL